jgi:hypothetical protein
VADPVDTAGPKRQVGIRTGSVREYYRHPRCACVSELECLYVTDPLTEEYIL